MPNEFSFFSKGLLRFSFYEQSSWRNCVIRPEIALKVFSAHLSDSFESTWLTLSLLQTLYLLRYHVIIINWYSRHLFPLLVYSLKYILSSFLVFFSAILRLRRRNHPSSTHHTTQEDSRSVSRRQSNFQGNIFLIIASSSLYSGYYWRT
jgi:Na+/H+ antiporter NhaD/arsenite permease-like protein